MKRRFFILGGSGFIGKETIKAAANQGIEVKALVRTPEKGRALEAPGVQIILGDAEQPESWIQETGDCDVLIDLVQPALPEKLNEEAIRRMSKERQTIARKITEAIRGLEAEKRPLYLSISGLDDLEPDAQHLVRESSKLNQSGRGFSIIGVPVRKIVEDSTIDAAFVYLATVYGPGKAFASRIIPNAVSGKLLIPGNGNNRITLVHVQDAARAIVHISLRKSDIKGRNIIVSDGKGATLHEFFSSFSEYLGTKAPRRVWRSLAILAAGRPAVETLTADRIAEPSFLKETGFTFQFPTWKEGVPATLASSGYTGAVRQKESFLKSLRFLTISFVTAIAGFVSVNLFNFRLSVPYMKSLSGGMAMLDLQLFYTPQIVYSLFDRLGEAGRSEYLREIWTVDLILPALACAFLAAALFRFGGRKIWLLAFAGSLMDYLENISITVLLLNYPRPLNLMAFVASAFTAAKFFFLGTGFLLLILGILSHRKQKNKQVIS